MASLGEALNWLVENLLYLGYALLLSHVVIATTRLAITGYFARKYGVSLGSWSFSFTRIVPVIALVTALEAVASPLVEGVSLAAYRPQVLREYAAYAKLGTGLAGLAAQYFYYVAEGVWLATALSIGSRAGAWDGLLALLAFWVPDHVLHGSLASPTIDLVNLAWALATALLMELARRRAGSPAASLTWMLVVVL